MDDSEKISGKKVFDILEQLKNNNTILNIHVIGTDFDGLSIILGVSGGENPRFFIDYPGKADYLAPLSAGKKCYIEFNDDNKIKYNFKTTIDSVFGKRIKFNFPGFIERSQRRKTFRIPVPSNTRATYSNDDRHFEFIMINISEGGALVSLKAAEHNSDILYEGSTLDRLSLVSKQKDGSIRIDIKSAVILRIEKVHESNRVNYGLKFLDMDNSARNELRRFIYYCQRRELQKRGELDV